MSFMLKPRICCPLFWPFIVCSAALKWENPAVCCNVRFCKGLYEWGRCGREPVWLSLQVVHRSDKLELETDFSSSGLVHWATQSAYDLQLDASFTSSIHHVVRGQAWSSLQLPQQWRWRTWFPASLGKLPKFCWRWKLKISGTGSDVPEIVFGCVGSVQHPSPPPDSSGQLTPQLLSLSECNHITSGLWPHLLYKVT